MLEVIVPKMGDAMEEGTVLAWLKGEGDEVSEGQDVPVGEVIAFIQGEGEEKIPECDGSAGGAEAEERGGRGGSTRRHRGEGQGPEPEVQVATSGFVTSLGGVLTLPVATPEQTREILWIGRDPSVAP